MIALLAKAALSTVGGTPRRRHGATRPKGGLAQRSTYAGHGARRLNEAGTGYSPCPLSKSVLEFRRDHFIAARDHVGLIDIDHLVTVEDPRQVEIVHASFRKLGRNLGYTAAN